MLVALITCAVLPHVGAVALVREVRLRRALQRLFDERSRWSNLDARKSARPISRAGFVQIPVDGDRRRLSLRRRTG
jgi:hypothetical protein